MPLPTAMVCVKQLRLSRTYVSRIPMLFYPVNMYGRGRWMEEREIESGSSVLRQLNVSGFLLHFLLFIPPMI